MSAKGRGVMELQGVWKKWRGAELKGRGREERQGMEGESWSGGKGKE